MSLASLWSLLPTYIHDVISPIFQISFSLAWLLHQLPPLFFTPFCNKNLLLSPPWNILLTWFRLLVVPRPYWSRLLRPLCWLSLLPNLLILVYLRTQSLICLSSLPTHFVHTLFQSHSFKYLFDKSFQIKISSLYFSSKFQTWLSNSLLDISLWIFINISMSS